MMIEKQNKDIEEKLGDKLEDVKKEMSGAIKIVADRQDKMETEQMDMKDQMGLLRAQMEDIKKIAEVAVQQQAEQHQQHQKQHQQQPDQQQSSVSHSDALQSSPKPNLHSPDFLPRDESERKKTLDLLDLGRRTVSLHPFKQSDFDFEANRGAKDPNEAKLWAVQTYLRYEMNIKSNVLATFTIEDIFTQAKESFDTVYVTFSSITEANTVYSYTKNMRREVTVGIFVPAEWQVRLKAINSVAYGLRYPQSGQAKLNTRIKWGQSDLVLHKKAPGTRHWSVFNVCTPLPHVDMCAVETPRMSPAPGRQGRDTKRLRPNGSGSDSDADNSELSRRRVRSKSVRDIDNGVPVPSLAPEDQLQVPAGAAPQDPGKVIAEESYCPSSPAPVKKPQTLPASSLESPIFKKAQSSSFRMNPLVL